jgi:iron(III) transport system permease protein
VLETRTPVRHPVGALGSVDWGRSFSGGNLLPLLLLAGVAFAAAYPLAMILLSSFRGGVPGAATPLTLDSWRSAFADPTTVPVFFSTMLVAVPRSILGLTLGVIFAWIMARTNTPAKRWLQGMLAFMFFLPDLPWILAWTLMGQPRAGLLNQWLSAALGTHVDVVNVYSYAGLIVLGAARSAVYLYLFLYPPFLAMDARLEEAARISGASARRAVQRIYLPLMAPALLGAGILSVIHSMSSFDLEQLLGVPAGISVFTTKIYEDIYGGEGKFGPATALAMMLLGLTFLLLLVQWKLLANKSFITISGRGYSAAPSNIGRWRWVAFGFVLVYFLVFGVLPFVILIIQSFMSYTGLIRADMITTEHWTSAFSNNSVLSDLKNTLIVGVLSATIGVIVVSAVAYTVNRTRWAGRHVLDAVAWLPWAVPGIVLALGFLWAFVYLPIYGTISILVLAFVSRGLPLGMRFVSPAMIQIGPELEESARVHGASFLRAFLRISAPLLRPALLGAWILLFVSAVRLLDPVLILVTAQTKTLAVEIFIYATSGSNRGEAYVLALIQTAIVALGYFGARAVAGREAVSRVN